MRWVVAIIGVVALAIGVHPRAQTADLLGTGTFSILGYDPDTGEIGAAVQSRVYSVGNGVLWAEADVGVSATQADAPRLTPCHAEFIVSIMRLK